jgi:hypothetical protein
MCIQKLSIAYILDLRSASHGAYDFTSPSLAWMYDAVLGVDNKTKCFFKIKDNCPVESKAGFSFQVLYLTFGKERSSLRTMIIT